MCDGPIVYWMKNLQMGEIMQGDLEKGTKEERKKMTALAKPINKISVIQEKDARKFVQEFNHNRVPEVFLDSCTKAGKLFGKRK